MAKRMMVIGKKGPGFERSELRFAASNMRLYSFIEVVGVFLLGSMVTLGWMYLDAMVAK